MSTFKNEGKNTLSSFVCVCVWITGVLNLVSRSLALMLSDGPMAIHHQSIVKEKRAPTRCI